MGSHVTERLVTLGCTVRVVDNLSTGKEENLNGVWSKIEFIRGDLAEPDCSQASVADIDVVFHLAALPSVPRSLRDPWASHQANCTATVQLLNAAAQAGVSRLVFSSSSSVYGETRGLPKVEDMSLAPRSPYAAAKGAAEHYVLAFARAGMIEGVSLRYFNVFGPRQDPLSQYAAVIPAFLTAVRYGAVANVFGDGEQTRDFTYVDNVVDANLLAASAHVDSINGCAFNVGCGTRTSLLDVLAAIRTVTGREVAVEHLAPRVGDVRHSLAGLERARLALGYEPRIGLEEGLQRTWEWFAGLPEHSEDPVEQAAAL